MTTLLIRLAILAALSAASGQAIAKTSIGFGEATVPAHRHAVRGRDHVAIEARYGHRRGTRWRG